MGGVRYRHGYREVNHKLINMVLIGRPRRRNGLTVSSAQPAARVVVRSLTVKGIELFSECRGARELAMARAPYSPHTLTLILVVSLRRESKAGASQRLRLSSARPSPWLS